MGTTYRTMTAFELCANYDDERFMLKRGRVVWESIYYAQDIDKCVCSRLVEASEGGSAWLMGLSVKKQYISPDTEIELV